VSEDIYLMKALVERRANGMTVAIVSARTLSERDGSSFRPWMQCEGLKANRFLNFRLFDLNSLDQFDENDFSIVHAHQNSGLLFGNYLADLHGVPTREFNCAISRYRFPKREAARLMKSREIEKMQDRLLGNAKGIICAGESIEEFARPLGRTYLVRNCVDLNRYGQCDISSTQIAVCGPFSGYSNQYQIECVVRVAKLFPRLSFLLIGRVEDRDLRILSGAANIRATAYVDNFPDALRTCSILFAPYASFSAQDGVRTKLIEAAACGMCIVATPYAMCDFYGDNVLVAEEISELGHHLEYLAESEDNRRNMAKSMRTYVSVYHNHITETKKLIKVYEEFEN